MAQKLSVVELWEEFLKNAYPEIPDDALTKVFKATYFSAAAHIAIVLTERYKSSDISKDQFFTILNDFTTETMNLIYIEAVKIHGEGFN